MSLATYGTIALLITRRHREEREGKQNPLKQPKRRNGWLIWTPVLALVGLISWSRVYMGVHNPSDVIGGWVVGAAWLAAVGVAHAQM